MQVIKPVNTCPECKNQFEQLQSLYKMYVACPEPGVTGVLQAAIEEYNQHHKDEHIRAVALDEPTPEKKQLVKDLLAQFPEIQIFGVEDENGKPLVNEGLIVAYKSHLIAVGPEGVKHLGAFTMALSDTPLEKLCADVWDGEFGKDADLNYAYEYYGKRASRK